MPVLAIHTISVLIAVESGGMGDGGDCGETGGGGMRRKQIAKLFFVFLYECFNHLFYIV